MGLITKKIFELDDSGNIKTQNDQIVFLETKEAIELRLALWKSLNTAELLAYGVRCELIDRQLVKEIAEDKLIKLNNNFKEIIKKINKCYGYEVEAEMPIWSELRNLAQEFSPHPTNKKPNSAIPPVVQD